MLRKLRKLHRYWSARLRPSAAVPLYWHVGTPNFGDDINPSFFERLSGRPMRLAVRQDRRHFLGMGSILPASTSESIILGSGLLQPLQISSPALIVSLRGELSRLAVAPDASVPLGDPMVLVDRLLRPDRGGDIGFVPHARTLPRLRRQVPPSVRLIDVSRDPWQVIREIGACRLILSQSLHGLIVADAFEIPNIWIAPSLEMVGDDFKFRDYFSTLDADKTRHELTADLLAAPPQKEASVSRYRGNKSEYQRLLVAA